jgi:5-methylcytosine-specific restriction enzyme subunit McrC
MMTHLHRSQLTKLFMNHKTISIFEFDYLYKDAVSSRTFDYFEQLCLKQSQEAPAFLRLCSHQGKRAIQVQHYVGVMQSPFGESIEVLPKVTRAAGDNTDDIQASRNALLNMLKTLKGFRHLQTNQAKIDKSGLPLFEVFISQFMASVNQLIKRGLRSDYVTQQGNLRFLKGKLLPAQQLRHNLVNKHQFYQEYDDYQLDRPANRLIHSALKKVVGYSKLNSNQRLGRELIFAFNEVPLSSQVKQDFAAVKLSRGMHYYNTPLAWAKLILSGFTPLAMQGNVDAVSLLFPMHDVFESYVADVLGRHIPPDFGLKTQASDEYLINHNGASLIQLKPDLLVYEHKFKTNKWVMDTKWKLFKNGRPDKNDVYQMLAYGHCYLRGEGELVLIYPKTANFKEPIDGSFDFNIEKSLRLWLVPFDICATQEDQNRLCLPTQLLGACHFVKNTGTDQTG